MRRFLEEKLAEGRRREGKYVAQLTDLQHQLRWVGPVTCVCM
jgi:hypothetical protein